MYNLAEEWECYVMVLAWNDFRTTVLKMGGTIILESTLNGVAIQCVPPLTLSRDLNVDCFTVICTLSSDWGTEKMS